MENEDPRYYVKENDIGGPGFLVMDSKTGRSVAWIYDQDTGWKDQAKDRKRALKFADILSA